MTSTLDASRPLTSGNGTPARSFDLDPPDTGPGRSRWPELTFGLVIVGVFALIGAWFYSNASTHVEVLALRSPVERGAVIESSDLSVVELSTEDALNTLASDEAALVVGNIALTDLTAGTLVTSDLFASRPAIAIGDGIVGLALAPGQFPTLSLRPGDAVRVVETPRQADAATTQMVLVETARVVDVSPIGVQGQLFISLSMSTTEADVVSAAASQDRVRLIQVGEE